MRLLVCGGRDFTDPGLFESRMDGVNARYPIAVVIQGGARGADSMAKNWANRRGVALLTYVADWDTYGPRAGSIRNRRMAVEGRPDLVLAFPGGAGTRNMIGIAREVGITVWLAAPFPDPQPVKT